MASGTCGENLTWSFSGNRLVISDTGFERILCDGNHAEIIYYDDKPAAQIKTPSPARKPKHAPVVEKLR